MASSLVMYYSELKSKAEIRNVVLSFGLMQFNLYPSTVIPQDEYDIIQGPQHIICNMLGILSCFPNSGVFCPSRPSTKSNLEISQTNDDVVLRL